MRILNKMLNVVIIIGIILIIIIIFVWILQKQGVDNSFEMSIDENNAEIDLNSYDELDIAYGILHNYTTYIYANDYDHVIKLYKKSQIIDVKDFEIINKKLVEKDVNYSNVFIESQKKINENTYSIIYISEALGKCNMTYKVDKENYSFIILKDSNFGVE